MVLRGIRASLTYDLALDQLERQHRRHRYSAGRSWHQLGNGLSRPDPGQQCRDCVQRQHLPVRKPVGAASATLPNGNSTYQSTAPITSDPGGGTLIAAWFCSLQYVVLSNGLARRTSSMRNPAPNRYFIDDRGGFLRPCAFGGQAGGLASNSDASCAHLLVCPSPLIIRCASNAQHHHRFPARRLGVHSFHLSKPQNCVPEGSAACMREA